jgi:hypothetical protein
MSNEIPPPSGDFDLAKLAAAERELLLIQLLKTMTPDARARIVGPADLENRPYYKETVAMEILDTVNGMMQDKRERLFPYDLFQEMNGWQPNTLYLYVQQAIDWLKDNYDPDKDGRYKEFRDSISITKRKDDAGVRLIWKEFVKNKQKKGGLFSGVVKIGEESKQWLDTFKTWFGNPYGAPILKMENLELTNDEVEMVRTMLDEADNQFFVTQLDNHNIKIGRK